MACKPLRQEQVSAGPVHVGDRRVPQCVERVEPIESSLHLPGSESELNAALADADAALRAEEGIPGLQSLSPSRLVRPILPEFTHQRVRQENIARSPTLGDFGADFQASAGNPIIYLYIPHVKAYNLRQS